MQRELALLLAVAMLAVTLPAPATAASPSEPVKFGMGGDSIDEQIDAGVKPDYATFWVGPWTLKHGWGGPGGQMDSMRDQGITPAIHYYYWGDDITPDCVENGCWSDLHNTWKDKARWQQLADELVRELHEHMQGEPVLILLETEFNKGGVSDYEAFDGYLAEKANYIRENYPAAKIVMPLGNWNRGAWSNFDEAAQASDYVGVQGMRGSTRDSLDSYRSLYEETLTGAQTAQDLFGKPVLIHDLALSSYPEPEYLDHQEAELSEFFDGLDQLKAAGVEGLIYRSWLDAASMDLNNYYGEAERHWGFERAYDGGLKPSAQVWIDGVQAERSSSSTPSGVPVNGTTTHEASAFSTKTAGGGVTDADALDDRAWNLWSNGHLAETFDVEPGTYELSIRARGTLADGTGAHMDVTVDGEELISRTVPTTYEEATARVNASGLTDLSIAFTNDKLTSDEDRNLLLDRVTFHPIGQPPSPSLDAATDGLTVSLDASASTDPDGDSLAYEWQLGDGATATGPTVEHTYATAGTYTVELVVQDAYHTATETASVTVQEPNAAPTPAIDATVDDQTVQLDASSSTDPDGDDLSYSWQLGDGATATGPTTEHTYAAGGTYTVELVVDDGRDQARETTTVEIQAPNGPPTPVVDASTQGLSIRLDASASTDPDGDPLTYDWQLGDGTSLTGPTVEHAYAEPGDYVVNLEVSDGDETSLYTGAFEIEAPSFEASFDVSENVNEWWIETNVTASAEPASVEARVDDGDWTQLEAKDWGTWAKSIHAEPGSTVTFRATGPHGQTVTSQPVEWLAGTQPDFTATFTVAEDVNEWWIETIVDASSTPASVEARVDGGAWTALESTDWGTWAKSIHAEPGSTVTFRATGPDGQTVTSEPIEWLPDAQPDLQAEFTPKTPDNAWWIEVDVTSEATIERVEACIEGSDCVDLNATDWGTWAIEHHVENATVEFRAHAASGATTTSTAYTWG